MAPTPLIGNYSSMNQRWTGDLLGHAFIHIGEASPLLDRVTVVDIIILWHQRRQFIRSVHLHRTKAKFGIIWLDRQVDGMDLITTWGSGSRHFGENHWIVWKTIASPDESIGAGPDGGQGLVANWNFPHSFIQFRSVETRTKVALHIQRPNLRGSEYNRDRPKQQRARSVLEKEIAQTEPWKSFSCAGRSLEGLSNEAQSRAWFGWRCIVGTFQDGGRNGRK